MINKILRLTAFALLLGIIAGCGGGGGSDDGRVKGRTVDSFGAPLGGNIVSMVFQPLTDVFHPGADGNFDFSLAAGTYQAEFLWYDNNQGIEISWQDSITVTAGQTLELGDVQLINNELNAGWTSYRASDYPAALNHFNAYLTDVRNGHANAGSNSALDGLGWTYARVQDFSNAYTNLSGAVTASGETNADAMVGLGGVFLSVGYDGSNYTYDDSVYWLNKALNLPGNYTSSPTHDQITETDLLAARALANFLNGDRAACIADKDLARVTANTDGNFATLDTLNMLDWLVGNV